MENEAKAKYKICCRFLYERSSSEENGLTKMQLFNQIVEQEKIAHQLEDTFVFGYYTAMSRIRRNNLNASGNESPLAVIEPQLLQLIICMSRIKRSLTVSEGLHLCNQLIKGTPVQEKLIQFKLERNIYFEN